MRIKDIELVIIKTGDSYTAYPKNLPALLVQSETIDDIPKKLGDVYKDFVKLAILKDLYEYTEYEDGKFKLNYER